MKYLSIKILILCVLFPPVVYVSSVRYIEAYFQKDLFNEIESVSTGDTRLLLNGSARLKDVINRNVNNLLRSKKYLSWGLKATVIISTKEGNILYPTEYENNPIAEDPLKVAEENFKLLNEGLEFNLEIKLEHFTLITNVLLGCLIFISVVVLYTHYRIGLQKAQKEELDRSLEIRRLMDLEKDYSKKLKTLAHARQTLTDEIRRVKGDLENEKRKASRNEEDLLEELIQLEEKMDQNIELHKDREEEIAQLKEKFEQYEKERQKGQDQKAKRSDSIRKRFGILYKTLVINEKALKGFLDLTDEMKLKCEEIIHHLDQDPNLVQVKRKVFTKKTKETVLEVMFAYNGRLYYRNTKDNNRVEILTIGTKNSQQKDLDFINNL